MKKKTKRMLWSIGGVSVVLGGTLVAASYYLFTMAITRSTSNVDLYAGEGEAKEELENIAVLMERGEQWLAQKEVERLEQQTYDGLTLYGRYIANKDQTGKLAFLLHGYRGDSSEMGLAGKMYEEEGYDLFLPDARAHGESEGNYIGFGWLERQDQLNWLNQLIAEKELKQIVIHGESMGASTALMVAGEKDLPKEVKVIIADSPYTAVDEELSHQMKNLFQIPSFPFLQMGSALSKRIVGYTFKEASALEQVKNETPPLLFIHGSSDDLVPTYMSRELYNTATTKEKEIWIANGAGHVGAKLTEPSVYYKHVWSFVNRYIK
ncbi:alpha/beta hydrolase [Shouchella lehensis]|uniref:Peptidase S9 prolyl oligopeptidase catalytic domain-containing protein n=1 Tax=Shouchella lehensis G1 TaxID=1246626 RepID=A0A060LQM3_9BACI|nr:alpha/beta hydrolase [Shouchella lehensis]AIC93566.1 hypothetical protein BleG1_0963 [Shouchella lehensis G1]